RSSNSLRAGIASAALLATRPLSPLAGPCAPWLRLGEKDAERPARRRATRPLLQFRGTTKLSEYFFASRRLRSFADFRQTAAMTAIRRLGCASGRANRTSLQCRPHDALRKPACGCEIAAPPLRPP